jgi:hypothetical protein
MRIDTTKANINYKLNDYKTLSAIVQNHFLSIRKTIYPII